MTDITSIAQRMREAAEEEIMCREASDTSDRWQDEASPENVRAVCDALAQRDAENAELRAQIAALTSDFDLLRARLSAAKGTKEIWKDRAWTAEEQIAELAAQEPVAWCPQSQLDLLHKGKNVIVEADLSANVRFDEIPLFTRAAPPVPFVVNRPGTKCIGWVRDAIHEHDAKWVEAVKAAGGSVV